MNRMDLFKSATDDPEELAKLIDTVVQDMYSDGVPSLFALIDYLASSEDAVPA